MEHGESSGGVTSFVPELGLLSQKDNIFQTVGAPTSFCLDSIPQGKHVFRVSDTLFYEVVTSVSIPPKQLKILSL
jgi:hypothetical protein